MFSVVEENMSTKIKIEPYLSNPIFALVTGLLLVGFGFFAMRIAADDLLFFILVWVLTICGFSATVYGFMGIVEGKRKWIKGNSKEVRSLSQSLKVRYPTYILKVHKLKEKYETLHEKFPEVRAHSEEFKRRIKVFQAGLVELETQLHDNLQKQAPVMDNDNVDGIAKKVLWSNKQIALTQLKTALKALEDSESPIVPESYRGVLNRIHGNFKRLDGGVTLYHELLTACTSETAAFEAILALKQEVEELDALLSQHETELQELETDTQTRYELSEVALSMFQERFEEFKAGCE
jgi:predicted  nucleic acid-binding Zn-ribbon protein